jgi:hypothetical protein
MDLLETRTVALKACASSWVTITLSVIRRRSMAPDFCAYRVATQTFHALEHVQGQSREVGRFKDPQEAHAFWLSHEPKEPPTLNSHNPQYARACISATKKEREARKSLKALNGKIR